MTMAEIKHTPENIERLVEVIEAALNGWVNSLPPNSTVNTGMMMTVFLGMASDIITDAEPEEQGAMFMAAVQFLAGACGWSLNAQPMRGTLH